MEQAGEISEGRQWRRRNSRREQKRNKLTRINTFTEVWDLITP